MDEPGSGEAKRVRRGWRLLLGPALGAAALLLRPGDDPKIAWMAAVTIWMAAWWVTEAVPIPVTALLPLVLLPLTGIAGVEKVAPDYGQPTIFLFLGGFFVALGLETTGLHRRLALLLVHKVGSRPRGLVLGFMLSAGLLSMWISNTAAVMVHLPIALSVLAAVRAKGTDEAAAGRLASAVLIAVAYGANIGGLATPVGTPPNLIYRDQLAMLFPRAPSPSFAQWMTLGVPLSAAYLGIGWLLLTRVTFRLGGEALLGSRDAVLAMRRELGPVRRDERLAAAVFLATALLWVLRGPLGLGNEKTDSVIAVAAGISLFVLPSRDRPGERLLEWRDTARLPWGMLLVFGGGFALATGFQTSGLSAWLGDRLAALHGIPPFLLMLIVCVGLAILTEFASNTAATQMVLPVLAAASTAAGTDPRYLMIPATLAASCGFMMPVGSPTQTIVFGTGLVPVRDMVRAGIWFDLLGIALIAVLFGLVAAPVLGIDAGVLPSWAKP
ncbi:MAG TPA: SLC13 family permease [Planctomycetota bacterium]|nr:SLC13 family permease [Planctomycetota bacterium]